ncbi:MAG: 4Fe-4S dicluster domain-containing protein [Deltaproteobacteria bacterium]|nr:MAG: 4Fe-4S dicluster domain-containing protein [Deltaproteobacteria bacterium]
MSSRIDEGRRRFLAGLAAAGGLLVFPVRPRASSKGPGKKYDYDEHYWAYAVDTTKCIGCCACMRACRAENDVPQGRVRTWVERYRVDSEGKVAVDVAMNDDFIFHEVPGEVVKAFFVPKLCNHCEKSVCNQVCPVGAAYRTPDGVVLVDKKHCIGCGYCVQACPYGSRFINPRTHTADKCTFCYHRITRGLPPACVQACPKHARIYGDLKDPRSELSVLLRQRRFRLLKPEMGTHPKCYYMGLDREVI